MKSKIKVALKQKYSNTGLSDDVMDGVASILAGNVAEESQIDTAVAGCEPLLKVVQGSLDKERNARSEAEKLARELKEKAQQQEKEKPEPEENKDEPESSKIVSALAAQLEKISEKLENLTKENTQKTKLEQLTAHLSEKKVPESYYQPIINGRTFGDDFNVDDYATEVSNAWSEFQKEMVDERFKDVKPPKRGEGGTGDEVNPLAKMIQDMNKELTKEESK